MPTEDYPYLFDVCSRYCNQGLVARRIGKELFALEYRGFGDKERAIRRLSSMSGVPYSSWEHWLTGEPSPRILQSTWQALIVFADRKYGKHIREMQRLRDEIRMLGAA